MNLDEVMAIHGINDHLRMLAAAGAPGAQCLPLGVAHDWDVFPDGESRVVAAPLLGNIRMERIPAVNLAILAAAGCALHFTLQQRWRVPELLDDFARIAPDLPVVEPVDEAGFERTVTELLAATLSRAVLVTTSSWYAESDDHRSGAHPLLAAVLDSQIPVVTVDGVFGPLPARDWRVYGSRVRVAGGRGHLRTPERVRKFRIRKPDGAALAAIRENIARLKETAA